jgi:DNA excision repair protein ERCC-4
MMEKKLKLYLGWKGKLNGKRNEQIGEGLGHGYQKQKDSVAGEGDGVSEALKRKDQAMKERGASRRRVRGGAPATGGAVAAGGTKKEPKDLIIGEGEMRDEAERIADL